MQNFIGIDISINSTAVYIESNKGKKILSFTNKKDNNIYIKELNRYGVEFIHIERIKSDSYSENEILKINHYDKISSQLINLCIKYIDTQEKTYCQIEGYSFSKNTSSILDIVSLSTLIRTYLLKGISNIDITIISPSTLKLEACKLSYKPKNIGIKKPKFIYVNDDGISGGSFKKPQMFKALLDSNLETPINGLLRDYIYLIERDKIPNPIEDIIDSIFACKIKINEVVNDCR
jgi:hypothetical protein